MREASGARPVILPTAVPLASAILLRRPNRYLAVVELDGAEVAAHVPNPGRMNELMVPGYPVQLAAAPGEHRKTAWDLIAVDLAGLWVCIDNRLGGKLARRALEGGAIEGLPAYESVACEVRCGESRLDFKLACGESCCWVETKSCTLVTDGVGRFPDAPTARGRRHLEELMRRRAAGERAAVLFLIQRPDATSIRPHDETDPAFGETLRAAHGAGVDIVAHGSAWSPAGLTLHGPVAVDLSR